jgi:hypothetical protein
LNAFKLNRSNETAAVIGGKPAPGLEHRYPEVDCLVQVPDENQRIERAVLLPARFCIFRNKRSLGFADL